MSEEAYYQVNFRLRGEESIAFWRNLDHKQEVMNYLIAYLREKMSTKEGASAMWARIHTGDMDD